MNPVTVSVSIGIFTFLITILTLAFKFGSFGTKVEGKIEKLETKSNTNTEEVRKIRRLLFKEDGSLNYVSSLNCRETKQTLKREIEVNTQHGFETLNNKMDSLSEEISKITGNQSAITKFEETVQSLIKEIKNVRNNGN